jgi:hypothetical protein
MEKINNRFDNIYYKEITSDDENVGDEKIIISNEPIEIKYEIVSSDDENEDCESDKRILILLELVNRILYNIGKQNIADLTEFKLINRNDITKQDSTYKFMKKKIYLHFSKYNFKINKKNDNILHCLEKAVESLNYKLICEHKFVSITVNGISYSRQQKFYSIKKV